MELDDLWQALLYCDSAFMLYRGTGDSSALGRMEQLKGECLGRAGDHRGASEHLETALTMAARFRDTSLMARTHRSLGSVHYFQRQFEKAWEHYHEAVRLFRSLGDLKQLSRSYNNMCILAAEYDLFGEAIALERAMVYGDSALIGAKKAEDSVLIALVHINLALVLMHMKDLAPSRAHTDSALLIALGIGDSLSIVHAFENRGLMALRDGDFPRARSDCEVMLRYGGRHGILKLKRDAMRCIMDAYRLEGDWLNAFLALGRYFGLRDSMYDASSREAILARSLEAESARRLDAEQVAHEAGMRRVKNGRIAIAAIALILVMGGVSLWVIDRGRRNARTARLAAQLETKALRSQMNPHFIFNALNSINNYVQENDRELASGFLTRFARLMRLVLENSRQAEVPLAQDLEALRLYLDLERARLKEKFDYRIEVDPAVDQQAVMVPPLMVQPFVENAIWHGIARKEGRGHIVLTCRLHGDQLVMTVEDDGPGRSKEPPTTSPDPLEAKTSLGTSITRSRLEMLAQQRGGRADFRFVDLPQGLRVEVEMPVAREG